MPMKTNAMFSDEIVRWFSQRSLMEQVSLASYNVVVDMVPNLGWKAKEW